MRPLVALFTVLLLCAPADANNPEMRKKANQIAKRILGITKDAKVQIGQFTGTGLPGSNAGPGIEGLLRDEMDGQKPGVIVERNGSYEVNGSYGFFVRDRQSKTRIVKVTIRVVDLELGETVDSIPGFPFDSTSTIAALIGATGQVPDKDPDTKAERGGDERKQDLQRLNDAPTTHVHGTGRTKVSSSQTSPYDVEILTGPPARAGRLSTAEALTIEHGHAFADIAQGDIYAVRITNRSDKKIAVRASIDGLDLFHFAADHHRLSNGAPQFTHHLIDAGQTATLEGWFHSLKEPPTYRAFLITEYGQGAASRAKIARGRIGQIHLQFSLCRELGPNENARGGKETGFGPDITRDVKAVKTEIDVPHDFLTIRYDRPE